MDRACHRTTLALPWLLNGSLAADERRAVREHLIGCATCRGELARTREALAMAEAGLSTTRVRDVAASAGSSAPLPPVVAIAGHRRWPGGRLAVAAAATVAVALSAGMLWNHTAGRAPAAASHAAVLGTRQAPAPVAPAPIAVVAPAPPTLVAEAAVPAPSDDSPASATTRAARHHRQRATRPSREEAPGAREPQLISELRFDGGVARVIRPDAPAVAAIVQQPAVISTFDFENGTTQPLQRR